jgi:hypothetical protein
MMFNRKETEKLKLNHLEKPPVVDPRMQPVRMYLGRSNGKNYSAEAEQVYMTTATLQERKLPGNSLAKAKRVVLTSKHTSSDVLTTWVTTMRPTDRSLLHL